MREPRPTQSLPVARAFLVRCFCSVSCKPVEGQGLLPSGLKAQTFSCVLATRLFSMYAPIVALAFAGGAFPLHEPENKS
jgi:hypothetical protein